MRVLILLQSSAETTQGRLSVCRIFITNYELPKNVVVLSIGKYGL